MKVDRNQLVPNVDLYNGDSAIAFFGVPLRLEIAARFVASITSEIRHYDNEELTQIGDRMLEVADLLIAAHNETCGVGPDDEVR